MSLVGGGGRGREGVGVQGSPTLNVDKSQKTGINVTIPILTTSDTTLQRGIGFQNTKTSVQ